MDTRRLEYFTVIAEELSFSRAAARLGVAQSTLSAGLRTLEQELGGKLVRRIGRRVELSAAGIAALPSALSVLHAVEEAGAAVAEVESGSRGQVRVAVASGIVTPELPALLGRFASARPEVVIETSAVVDASAAFDGLRRGSIDIAIAPLFGAAPAGLTTVPIVRDRLQVVVPEGHATACGAFTADRLVAASFVEMGRDDPIRTAVDRLMGRAGIVRSVVAEVGGTGDLLDLVRAGLGVAILPSSRIPARTGLAAVPLAMEDSEWIVVVARSAGPTSCPAARRLFETMADGLSLGRGEQGA